MMDYMNKEKTAKRNKDHADTLAWILHEWNCRDLEEAKKMSVQDRELHYALREIGIVL